MICYHGMLRLNLESAMIELSGEDKTNVMAKINQAVVNYFTQVMQMDSFTLCQEVAVEGDSP